MKEEDRAGGTVRMGCVNQLISQVIRNAALLLSFYDAGFARSLFVQRQRLFTEDL